MLSKNETKSGKKKPKGNKINFKFVQFKHKIITVYNSPPFPLQPCQNSKDVQKRLQYKRKNFMHGKFLYSYFITF